MQLDCIMPACLRVCLCVCVVCVWCVCVCLSVSLSLCVCVSVCCPYQAFCPTTAASPGTCKLISEEKLCKMMSEEKLRVFVLHTACNPSFADRFIQVCEGCCLTINRSDMAQSKKDLKDCRHTLFCSLASFVSWVHFPHLHCVHS
jgi:hypothetical protein